MAAQTHCDDRSIKISGYVDGNVIVSGNGNIVIFQTSQQVETELPSTYPIGPNSYQGLGAFLEKMPTGFSATKK